MFSQNALDILIQPILNRQETINIYVIKKIVARLMDVKTLRPSDLKTLKNLVAMGADIRAINAEIARLSDLQVKDIKSIIRTVAIDSYMDAKPFYDYRYKSFIPFNENKDLQRVVKVVGDMTAKSYVNLSNSKAIGFLVRDPKNPTKTKFQSLAKTYQQTIDTAIQAIQSKTMTPEEAIRKATKELLNSGLRRLYWESGYNQRLDTAVRRNILDGVREINQRIQDEIGKQINADGKELSAHANSAPDHEPFQGHIFTNAEWDKLQSSDDFKDIDGKKFMGVDRIIGVWNCHHIAYSIVIGAKKRRYTKEQLQKFIDDNHSGYTLKNGKHLTMYECTQVQRRLETRIRYAKEEQMLMAEIKDKARADLARKNVQDLIAEYRLFSSSCGLKTNMRRAEVPGYNPSVK